MDRLRGYVREYGSDVFSTDGQILFCKICEVKVAANKKFTITQHVSRDNHKQELQRKISGTKNQVLLTVPKSPFFEDLTNAFLSANIPQHKLNQPIFRQFLEKYTNKNIPDESTLRKYYVCQMYENTLTKIRQYIQNKNIWISIDETTDVEGRYVANVIVGTLEVDTPGKVFLLNSDV